MTDSKSSTIRMTTAQAIIRYLQVQFSERDGERRRVIPAAYGLFGHGNVVGFGEALDEVGDDLPFYQTKNEQAMVHIAIGFAKASRRLSTLACFASIGPGSTNMITGAATATVNRIPVLLFAADTFASRQPGTVLQQIEHPLSGDTTVNDCFRPVSRYFDRIARPEQVLTALPEAMRILLDPAETGAVTISVHQDVQGEAHEFPAQFFEPRTWHVVRRPVAEEELDRAVDLLRKARRPFVIAGGGVRYSDAGKALARFATNFGLPVGETFAGKGTVPAGDLVLGGVGATGTGAANAVASQADVVLLVGTRLQDFTTGSNSLFQHPDVRFIALNVNAADANKLAALPIVADAARGVEALANALEPTEWKSSDDYVGEIRRASSRWSAAVEENVGARTGELLGQGELIRTLNSFTRPEDVVIVAAGSPPADVHKLWNSEGHAESHLEFGFSCMAHEIPSGLGYRMARGPIGEIYVVIGEGTYLMGNTELVTAVQEHLKITVILVVNDGYQSIRDLQVRKTGNMFATELRAREEGRLVGEVLPIDFGANARSLGCLVLTPESNAASFGAALDAARSASGPTVIVCHTQPHRMVLGGDCWWDVGVSLVSSRPEMVEIAREHVQERARQRFYYAVGDQAEPSQ